MTTVDAILDIIRDATENYFVTWGFEVDMVQFLERQTVPGPVVFLSVGAHIPDAHYEGGNANQFTETFSVFLARQDHVTDQDTATYREFLSLRDALNGASISVDGRAMTVMIMAADPSASAGELTLQVV